MGREGRFGGIVERGVASATAVAVTVAMTVDGLTNASVTYLPGLSGITHPATPGTGSGCMACGTGASPLCPPCL